jgi:hypothetical protein
MGDPVPESKTPVFVAVGVALIGLVIGLVVSSGAVKIVAGLIAAGGAIPSMVGMWKGIQQEGQGTLAMSLGALLFSLGIALVLIIWGVVVIVT